MRPVSPDHLIPLGAEVLGLFAAARDGLARLADAVEPATLGYAPVDLCAEEHAEMLPVVSALHGVVHAAMAAVTESTHEARSVRDAPSPASAMAELEHALRWTYLPAQGALNEYELREYARKARTGLVRDIGLEAFDARCRLVGGRRFVPSLSFELLTASAAPALLARRVIHRADKFQFAVNWPLLLDELEAAQWLFESWGIVPPSHGPVLDFRRWDLRGSEWGAAERPSILFGDTLCSVLASRPFNAELRPRQCAMARSIASSFSGVFVCESLGDQCATFTDVQSGRSATVLEHRVPAPYDDEWLAFGRLIPLGDGRHVRSEGMAFMSPTEARSTRASRRAEELLSGSLQRTLAVEGALSVARYEADVPRTEPPWADSAWARRQLAEFRRRWSELESSGADEGWWRAPEPPKLDAAVTGWLAALEELALQPDLPPGVVDIGGKAALRLARPDDGGWYRDN